MAKIAIITKARLEQSQGAPGKSILVDIDGHGIDNAEFYQIPGLYNRPQDGVTGLVLDCNGNNIIIAGHDYQFDESIEKGEMLIYSYGSNGAVVGKILIKINGDIEIDSGGATFNILSGGNVEINGNADSAVAFTDLKTAFDQLKTDLNNFITVFNAHVHPGVTSGSASTSASATPGISSAADMSGAEVPTVKLP